jgi:hypothetical protein
MTRRNLLYAAWTAIDGRQMQSVSKKLTNNFLTFGLFGASLISVRWNRDVNDRFLSISHAIG